MCALRIDDLFRLLHLLLVARYTPDLHTYAIRDRVFAYPVAKSSSFWKIANSIYDTNVANNNNDITYFVVLTIMKIGRILSY